MRGAWASPSSTSGKERPCSTRNWIRASNPAADSAKHLPASSALRRRGRRTSACCMPNGWRRHSAPCSHWRTTAVSICSFRRPARARARVGMLQRLNARVLPGGRRTSEIERSCRIFLGRDRTFKRRSHSPVRHSDLGVESAATIPAGHVLVCGTRGRIGQPKRCARSAAPAATTGCRSSCPVIA